jgi:hypothetical protein
VFFRNPVPTTGQVRSTWSRNKGSVQPAVRFLRVGVYVALGLGLTGLGLRRLADLPDGGDEPSGSNSALAERGERAARDVLVVPAVSRTTERASEVSAVVVSRAGRVVDEAHDSVEEAYGRFYLGLARLGRAVLPAWLRRDLD